jgi:hypothetical protein
MRWHQRNQRGAVAVMFALTSVLLMSMAGLGVDLGSAWAQKRQVQTSTDSATIAGAGIKGADLPAPATGKVCPFWTGALATDPGTQDVARYVASKAYSPTLAPAAVPAATVSAMATQLTDCDVTNGEVFYGIPTYSSALGHWTLAYNKNQLSLVSPPTHVGFGFSRIIGITGANVTGQSTVEIDSPKFSALPFYAFNGCDYGEQTLQQPNNGQAASTVMLANPTDPTPSSANTATLTSVTPASYPVDNTPALEPITLVGTNLTGVTQIGFFESGNGSTGPPPVTSTNFSINAAGTQITMPDIPTQTRGVAGVQEYWYIRVLKGTNPGQWSSVFVGNGNNQTLNTPILQIGTPPLVCAQGSSSGNFGTLLLSHAGYTGADNVGAANVALGLTNTLSIYPTAGAPADGTCSSAQPATVLWNTDGTNCVDTDTGMSANVASGGFLGLGSSAVGGNSYLMYPNHKTTCANNNTTEATTTINGKLVNNDTLTCFFLSPTTHISDVDADPALGGYTGAAPLLSPAIYDSPRFAYVPVLHVQPANGGSAKYQIVDFRACFITDQPPSAVLGDGPGTPNNGFVMDSNGVHSVQVVFLNPNALPVPPTKDGTINYIGSGPKIPVMVN